MKAKELIPVRFPEDNKCRFGMDMQFWEGIPHDIDFYAVEAWGHLIRFVGDGYGLLSDNEFGLKGDYGSGAIHIDYTALPSTIQVIVYYLFKEQIESQNLKNETERLKSQFAELVEKDFGAAKDLMNRITEPLTERRNRRS